MDRAAAPGDGWLTTACPASATGQLLVPLSLSMRGQHELGHVGTPWVSPGCVTWQAAVEAH